MQYFKITLAMLASLLYFNTIGQIKFEPGYIVDDRGKKTECFIENKDWASNPKSFQYKRTEDDQPILGTTATIKEFCVYNYSKFLRATVQLDTSRNYSSTSRKPEWAMKTLFLRIVVSGSASLYSYNQDDLLKFFFSTVSDSTIRQLVTKKFYISQSQIGENNDFRQQLSTHVKCGEYSKNYFNGVAYTVSQLKKHFIKYNTCMGDEVNPTAPQEAAHHPTRDLLNFKITPGINYSAVTVVDDLNNSIDFDFDKGVFFRGGVEMEYIFPFNKNKWSIFFEPTYQYYQASEMYQPYRKATIEYQSIEFPIGFRYYIFLKKDSKIFFSMICLPGKFIDLSDSKITYDWTYPGFPSSESTNDIITRVSFATGVGYTIGPLSIEARYYVPQNLFANNGTYHAPYQRLTLIAGYRFLKLKTKVKN